MKNLLFLKPLTKNLVVCELGFRNKFLREKNQANKDNYKIQRNLCKKNLRKTKTHILAILIQKKNRTDNRTFWKTVVPLFTNKHCVKYRNFI